MAITINGTTGITSPGLSVDSPTLVVDDANNRVGIGTDNPPAELTVDGFVVIGNPETTGSGGTLRIAESSNSIYIQPGSNLSNDSSCDLIVSSIYGATERLRITSTGNVGIGTDNPNGKLEVKTGSGSQFIIDSENSSIYHTKVVNNSGDLIVGSRTTSGDTIFTSQRNIFLKSGSSEETRLTINSDGNIGIDKTNPGYKLELHQGNMRLYTNDTWRSGGGANGSTYPFIQLNGDYAAANNPGHGRVTVRHSAQNSYSGDIVLQPYGYYDGAYTYVEDVLRVSAYKRVGINISGPTDTLTVYNSNVGNPTGITIRNTEASSQYSHARLRLESQNAAAYGEIWADVANAGLRLGYNSSNTVKINSSGNIVFNSGSGIDFSATSDGGTSTPSELLDDYEEGSWSPQVRGWNGSYSTSEGRYIKIGRKVHIIGEVRTDANVGNSFTYSWPGLSNLPFANTTSFQGVSGSQRHMGTGTILGDVSPGGTNGIAFVTFDRNDGTSFFPNHISSSGAQNFQNTMINNPTTVDFGYRFNCTYYTD